MLVAAELLHRPSYAAFVTSPQAFRAEVLAMHRRVTSAVDVTGRVQVPWPRALGTPPWAVAHQLSGTTGIDHDWHWVGDRGASWDEIQSAAGQGFPVPVYVGNRWLPRHVVLVAAAASGTLRVYDPAPGAIRTVTRGAFTEARLRLSGWDRPWFTVTPVER